MPRIFLSTRVFLPEIHPTAMMMSQLARRLGAEGWGVDVLTGFPSYPKGELFYGYHRAPIVSEERDGYHVHRLWHPLGPAGRTTWRLAEVGAKAVFGPLRGLSLARPDVILTVGTPLLGPVLWGAVAACRRAHLVDVVYDLYPDIAVESGRLRNPALVKAAQALAWMQWRSEATHVVLSEGFRSELLRRGVPPEKITVLPVWLDTANLAPGPRDNAWRREQQIPLDKVVVLYAGTIGVVSGASVLAEVASLLSEREDILFLFVGEGAERENLRARCAEIGLKNVRFLPFQPAERLAEMQATADIGAVTLAPGRGRTSVPSKVLGYMAAARPVVAAVDVGSDTAREIEAGGFGVVVPPAEPRALARAITALVDDDARRHRLGEAGRRRVVEKNDVEVVLARWVRLLEDLTGRSRCL